jgi:hypothetical protein
MPDMMLRLADHSVLRDSPSKLPPGYQFVSIGDSGVFIHESYLSALSKKKGGLFKKFVQLNKKLAMAPFRRSFRTLIALNVHGMAKKLKHRIEKGGEGKLRKKWEMLGGKFSELMKSINAGAKRKALLDGIDEDNMLRNSADEFPHFKRALVQFIQHYKMQHHRGMPGKGLHDMEETEQLGVVQLAAVLAAAVPIIGAIFGGKNKKEAGAVPGEDAVGGTPTEKIIQEAKSAAVAAGVPESIINADPSHPEHADKFDKQEGQDDSPKKDSDKIFGMPKMVVFGGGAALALYLIMKKK